ncbi:MAG: hypothetical protein JWM71_516 [Solirubrobacteraceae bacterium]|nr:hypothetical protein [Solirubrobacteraceae bacterium]
MADHGSPASYLTLEAGTPVFSSDEQPVGTVEHVLAIPDDDIFDGLVLDTPHGRRFADAPEVQEIFEQGVVLNIPASEAANLPEPSENPGVLSAGPDDTVPDHLRDKLRRAWDLVSGKY